MTEQFNGIQVGELLIRLRKRLRLSQFDVAQQLGLANSNFISMIERGRSQMPLDKFTKFMEVYEAEPDQSLLIFRSLWPSSWEAMCYLDSICGSLHRTKNLEIALEKYMKTADTTVFSASR
jgi:transcriptional regulator with XRE-family HTH domain